MPTSELTPTQTSQLEEFAELVAQSPHNLVSRRARGELRTRHIPEAVALARTLPPAPARVLDVGSGGGFPGMVIAVVRPDVEVHLLDATRKKVEFLQSTAHTLGLDLVVHHGRAEQLATSPQLARGFDIVTARAVAALRDLVVLTEPFLAPSGVLYAIKGERWQQELEAATRSLEASGLSVLATPDEDNPGEDAPRVVMLGRPR